MKSKLKYIFVVTFTLFLLSVSIFACTCEREKIKAKGFSGRVVIQTAPEIKQPLSKAIIKLLKRIDGRDIIVAEVVTDEDGRFAVPNIESGKYILKAEALDFQKLSTEIKIVKGSSRKKELEIGLEVAAVCCAGYFTVRQIN